MRMATFLGCCVALTLGFSGGVRPCSAQQIAFTWDDLPAHSAVPPNQTRLSIIHAILQTMKTEHLPPAYGFINGVATEREPGSEAVLLAWREAGLPLGNHTWSHLNLEDHTALEFEQEIQRNEPLLQKLMKGKDWHWLRYPFLAEGTDPAKRAEVRAYLAAHGYRVAAVTMSFGDYAWNGPYARCVAKHDQATISGLETSYLKAAENAVTNTRRITKERYGRDIPYVLLMHVGAFDARMLPRLLDLYKQGGATFVTLEQAQADPVYRSDTEVTSPGDPSSPNGRPATEGPALPPGPAPPDFSALCR